MPAMTTSDASPDTSKIQICRLQDLGATPALIAGIDRIFFQTANRTFSDDAQRSSFRALWLGQYLTRDADKVHVAVSSRPGGAADVAGYLVGCWDNPAITQRFAELPFFRDFAAHCQAYPGQLHINLDAAARSRGIGRLLVEAFAQQSAAAGIPGIHVVTGAAARNVGFYQRAGFVEKATTLWNGHRVIFLGRTLS
jgi:GNAT superfamily N-acetyltransferase